MAYLPVSYNSKTNQADTESKIGLSDASLLGFYRILRSKITIGGMENSKLLMQDLWIGVVQNCQQANTIQEIKAILALAPIFFS